MPVFYTKPVLRDLSQGARIAYVRQFRHMTQEELGKMIGKSKAWYVDIERGKNNLYFSDAKSLCEALNIDINELAKYAGGNDFHPKK